MTLQTVALPAERFAQLRRLADADGASLSDTVASLLDIAIEAGRLPDELPGWNIQRLGGNVLLAHPETGFAKLLPTENAKTLGDTLIAFSMPASGRRAVLDLDAMVEIRRQGAGIILRDADTLIERSLAANVAGDLGRRLVRAAA